MVGLDVDRPSRHAERRLVRSTLARRLILGLSLGTLVPLMIFGFLAFRQVTRQLLTEVDHRLHQETKTVAMGIVERLLYLEASLELLGRLDPGTTDPLQTASPRLIALAERQFDALSLLRPNAPPTRLYGPLLDPGRIDEAYAEHLAAGRTAILTAHSTRAADTRPGVGDVLLVHQAADGTRLVARARPSTLWGTGPEAALPSQVGITVLDGEAVLVRSDDVPADLTQRVEIASATQSSGQMSWRYRGEDFLASFWIIPMEANYSTEPWVVVLARRRALALAPLNHFRLTFPLLIALTLWLVLLISIRQVRLGLGPLSQLREAMDRISDTDFTARVQLETGDEIEALADHFNAMAAQLGDDFASRQALTRALDAQRSQLDDLVEQLPHGVLLLDAELRMVLANRLGRAHLSTLTTAGEGDRIVRLGSLDIETITPVDGPVIWSEVRSSEPDGQVFAITRGLVRTDTDEPGSVLVIRDITIERASQDQLRRQERLAAVGQLAAGMAHDLNNTLQVILSAAQLLQARDPSLSERREIEMILDQSRHGASLIRQVLDFSRRSPHDAELLDLRRLLSETLDLLRRMLPATIELHVGLPSQSVAIRGDATQLQQVVTNLVLNARDAMPTGGRMDVTLEGGPNVARIRFEDTGEGISDAVRARIFDPFFTTKEPGRGTGLGLAQVYGIVDAHGGQIQVDSTLGVGTRFTVTIPISDGRVSSEPTRAAETPAGQQQSVLVVEDQEVVREIVRTSLETLGYTVTSAIHGADALAKMEDGWIPDLVISDVIMPQMGGRELAEALHDRHADIPIVLMSGYSDEDASSLLAIPGVHDVLPKPVALDHLARAIDKAMANHRPR